MQKRILFFDVETTEIEDFTRLSGNITVHCLSIFDLASTKVVTFHGDSIRQGVTMLEEADEIVGHNIIGFDIPVLKKVYRFAPKGRVFDTLLMARVEHPDTMQDDYAEQFTGAGLPKKLRGSHSLEAWGHRLGIPKGAYGKEDNAWDTYNEEMREYCEQDCLVTHRLWDFIQNECKTPDQVRIIEHTFAHIIRQQEQRGFAFDTDKAEQLIAKLSVRRAEIKDELQKMFDPTIEEMKSPLCWRLEHEGEVIEAPTKGQLKEVLKERGIKQVLVKDAKKVGNKKKVIPFNPSSRQQIADRLMKLGWKPKLMHSDGETPRIDEPILKSIKHPSAGKLLEYLLVTKRLGHLAEGKQGWVNNVVNGRIHGKVNTNGAVTGRCTHSNPNLAQVPAVRAEYGAECRELFKAGDGYVLAGTDASGLELRCLAHYLAFYDGGEYGKYILEDDIHTVNMKAAGLTDRDQAKTFIYAFLYGAGDGKIGDIVGGKAADGRRLKERFLNSLPSLKRLKKDVEATVRKRGILRGIDGRRLPIRSEYAALNTLLQSCGAVVMKQSLIELYMKLHSIGWTHGKQYAFVGNIHDEFQAEVKPELAEIYSQHAVNAITQAGKILGMKCRLDGECMIGNNWKETH